MRTPRTMPGVLELLPAEQLALQRMLDTIREVFELFGFVPIETPAIELTEVLLTKTGGETERQVYFVRSTGALDQEGAPELALRFDLTVPLARYVAEHEADLTFPFRRYQVQPVYRGERPQRGRFREFYQCDADVVGRDHLGILHDAEMPAVIDGVFTALDIGAFTIRINNRKLMRGLLAEMGLVEPGVQAAVLREVDKLDRRGEGKVRAALADLGAHRDQVDRLMTLSSIRTGSHNEATAVLEGFTGADPLLREGVEELRAVLEGVRTFGVPEHRYSLDLSVARGLDYYTGTVYETYLDEHPEVGSICSGGRYDDLAGHYTSSRLPGVGISIGLTRLFWQLRHLGLAVAGSGAGRAMVTLMDEEGLAYAVSLAAELRSGGIPTEVALEPARLGHQLRRADRTGFRFAVIAGPDERARGTATVRDLATQTQQEVEVGELVKHLLDRGAVGR